MAVCLSAGAMALLIPANAFVLSWTHSVEQVVWRENWRVADDTLVLEQAEVEGSGAGMEPGPSARLVDGAWRWRPALPPQRQLRLAHSEFAGDYRLCWRDKCEHLATLITRSGGAAVEIRPCAPRERLLRGSQSPQSAARPAAAKEDKR